MTSMKTAIIYARGHNQEMQEVKCRLYAAEKNYKPLFVTNDITAISKCDVLIVANYTRISRDRIKFYEIMRDLEARGIEVESASGKPRDTDDFMKMIEGFTNK